MTAGPVRRLFLVLAVLVPAAFAPAPAAGGGPDPAGTWTDGEGGIYCLEEDGSLGLPGSSSAAGLGWRGEDGRIVLTVLNAPGTSPEERAFAIRGATDRTMTLAAEDGTVFSWRRSMIPVGRLDVLLVPEGGAAVPPGSMITARLSRERSFSPAAVSAARAGDGGPLRFRMWYLGQTTSGVFSASASVSHGAEVLLSTGERRVGLPADSRLEMPLHAAGPGDTVLPPLEVPARFEGVIRGYGPRSTVRLYLEKGGFALLTDSGSSEQHAGSWLETRRGSVVEITRGSLKPVVAARAADGGLFLSGLSAHTVEMKRDDSIPWPTDSFLIEGELSGTRNAPVFTECNSLRSLPVMPESRGYGDLVGILESSGQASVTIEGGVGDGGINASGVVVTRKGGRCSPGRNYASAPLEGTYWRLCELNGRRIGAEDVQYDPHLMLRSRGRAVGSDGCNNFHMSWKRDGGSLRFTPGKSTLMTCPRGGEVSGEFLDMFPKVDEWNISGGILELRSHRRIAAVFEAVDM